MLQGWNTIYKTEKLSEGFPVYHLKPYKLYYIIPIIGKTMKVRNVNDVSIVTVIGTLCSQMINCLVTGMLMIPTSCMVHVV